MHPRAYGPNKGAQQTPTGSGGTTMRRTITVVTAAVLLCLTSVASAAPGGGGGPGHGGGGGGGASNKGITLTVAPSLSVVEDETDGFVVAITRSGPSVSKCTTTFTVSTADGTATAPGDYGSYSFVLTFAKGQTVQSVFTAVVNDTVPEPTEAFTVNLSNVTTSCKGVTNTVTNAVQTVTVSDHDVVFNVPAGDEVVVSNLSLGGCDALSARLHTPDGDIALGDNSTDVCGNVTGLGATWTNNTGSDAAVTVLLNDALCFGALSFSSDTTSTDNNGSPTQYNHARTTPTGPGTWDLDITDGAGDCTVGFRVPAHGEGNLKANIAIQTPPPNPAFSVDPGKRATIVVTLDSCNALELLLIQGDTAGPLMTNEGSLCEAISSGKSGFTVDNPYGAEGPVVFTLRLVDTSCTTALYDSDGTGEANHAVLTGTDPIGVDINDGGSAPDCARRTTESLPSTGEGNLRGSVTVTDLPLPPFTGTVVLQPGETATMDITLSGCNTLEAYLYDGVGGDHALLGNLECDPIQAINVVENTGSSPYQFTLALIDNSCFAQWNSTGGPSVDHAAITTVHPYQLDIADGGADCELVSEPVEPTTGGGNLHVTITIN
jgi:hypothetical protein